MTATCIDCGLPAVPGSSYCGPCDSPIFESPREVMRQIREEMEAEER